MVVALETILDVTAPPSGAGLVPDGATDNSAAMRTIIDSIQRNLYAGLTAHKVYFPPGGVTAGGAGGYIFKTPVRWSAWNWTSENSQGAMAGISICGGGLLLDDNLNYDSIESPRLIAGKTTGTTDAATATTVRLPAGVATHFQAYQFCKIKMTSGPANGQEREIVSYEVDHTGTCGATTADSMVLDPVASGADDFYKWMLVEMLDGAAVGLRRMVKAYTGANQTVTDFNSSWSSPLPSSGDSYRMHGKVVSANRECTVDTAFSPAPTAGGGDTFEITCSPVFIFDGLGGAIVEGLNFYGRQRGSAGTKAKYVVGRASDVNSGQMHVRNCAFGNADIGWDNNPEKYSWADPGNKNSDLTLFTCTHWSDFDIVAFQNQASQAMFHTFDRVVFNNNALCFDVIDSGSFKVSSVALIKCTAFYKVTNSGTNVGGLTVNHVKIDSAGPRTVLYVEVNNKPHNFVTFRDIVIATGQGVAGGDPLFQMNGGKLTVQDSVFQEAGISGQRLVKLTAPGTYESTARFIHCMGFTRPDAQPSGNDTHLADEYIDFDSPITRATTDNWYRFEDCYQFQTDGYPFSEANYGMDDTLIQQLRYRQGLDGVQSVPTAALPTDVGGISVPDALKRIGAIACGTTSGVGSGTEVFTLWDATFQITVGIGADLNRVSIGYSP